MSRRKAIYEVQRMEKLGIIEVERNHHTSNVFILMDTSAQPAPLPGAPHAPPSAQPAPEQSPIKKNTHHRSNKRKAPPTQGRKYSEPPPDVPRKKYSVD
jgi:hypothetical protein